MRKREREIEGTEEEEIAPENTCKGLRKSEGEKSPLHVLVNIIDLTL